MPESKEITEAVAWANGLLPEDIEVRAVPKSGSSDPAGYEVVLKGAGASSTFSLQELARTYQAFKQIEVFIATLPDRLPDDVTKHLKAARDAIAARRHPIRTR